MLATCKNCAPLVTKQNMNGYRCHVLIVTLIATFIMLLSHPAYGSDGDDRFSLDARTKFIFYDENNRETTDKSCYATHRYAMIVHGYQEHCNHFWVRDLRKNLLEHRTGCIICMDYSDYNREYSGLIIHFKTITDILLNKMIELRGKGFRTRDAYFFGFSYGARLITRAALEFGSKPVGTIHLCEPAGPGFDAHPGNAEPLHVAYHSQCFHTDAGNYGTSDRSCHQDWILGECGNRQAAAGPRPLGSHGLCPVFYNLSFKHRYMAVRKSKTCNQPLNGRDLISLPANGIRMGYMQKITNTTIHGVNLYVETKSEPPYV